MQRKEASLATELVMIMVCSGTVIYCRLVSVILYPLSSSRVSTQGATGAGSDRNASYWLPLLGSQ